MKIGIATDHHGVLEKKQIVEYLKSKGYEIEDFGPYSTDSVDYPLYAFKLSEAVRDCEISNGILMCGTGIGMSIAANKVKGVRCARIVSVQDAHLAREHNHANVIAFSSSIPFDQMKELIDEYLNTVESIEERHVRRVNMIDEYNG